LAVNDISGMLPVRANPISTGTLKLEDLEAGPNVVAGTVDLECGIRLCSHVVKVAGHSMDVNYPLRTASGRGGGNYCPTTIVDIVDSTIFSVQGFARDSGGTQNNCMYEKKSVLKQLCSGVYPGVKTA